MHPYAHCSIIYNNQDIEAPKWTSIVELSKEDVVYIYIYNGILLSHKKNETLPFVTTWIDLEDIMLNEISQTKTNTIWFHLYVQWNLKNKTNEQTTKQKQTHSYSEQTGGCQRGWECRMSEIGEGN